MDKTYPLNLTAQQWLVVCESLRTTASGFLRSAKATKNRKVAAKCRERSEGLERIRDTVVLMLRFNGLAADVPFSL
jgi:hypothetical protein